jgi:hypothetical protein
MFKLAAVLLMLVVACNAFRTRNLMGGYVNHPELISDQKIQDLTSYAIGTIMGSNSLSNVQITGVQTQTVRGTNYKIDFIGDGANGQQTACQVVINVDFDQTTKNILQSQCQTS